MTCIVKFAGSPTHPFAEGTTDTDAVTIELPELVAVNDAMLPMPVLVRPMELLLLAHA